MVIKNKQRTRRKVDLLIIDILNLKDKAAKLDRFRTMHALDHAVSEAGWELADILTGKQKIGKVG